MTLALLLLWTAFQAPPGIRVAAIQGSAEVVRQGSASPARAGDSLAAGDRLRTTAGSFVSLAAGPDAALQLGPDSDLDVRSPENGPWAFLDQGSLKVRTAGRVLRIGTRYGQFTATEEPLDMELAYIADSLQVLVVRGSFRTDALDGSKVVFKGMASSGERVYEAGTQPRTGAPASVEPAVIVQPYIVVPPRGGRGPATPAPTR